MRKNVRSIVLRSIDPQVRRTALRRLMPAMILFSAWASGVFGTGAARGDDSKPPRLYVYDDTVRVVGQRIPGDPLRVPMSVTVLSADELRAPRSIGLDEALAEVPGILAQSRSGGLDVRITNRGFGARGAGERSNAGTTRGIRILLDGFPLTEPDGRTSLDLADPTLLERVAVVRSNSSVFFGSAAGGLIQLSSPTAFARPFAELEGAGGGDGLGRGRLATGVLLSPTARLFTAFSRGVYDGWREHSGAERSLLQANLLANPTSRSFLGVYSSAVHTLWRIPGALTYEQAFDADSMKLARPEFIRRDERRDNRILRIGARYQQSMAGDRVLQLSAFTEPKTIHRSERNRFRDFQRIHTGGSAIFGLGFQPGRGRALHWNTGLDEAWQDGSTLFYDLGPGGSRGSGLVANKREAINTLGIFSELVLELGDQWTLTAGARHDWIRYIFEDYIDSSLDDSETLKRVTPRAAVSWHVQPKHTLFAGLSGGLEAPAFNEVDPPAPYDTLTGLNPFLKPARSWTWEGGARGTLLGEEKSTPEPSAFTLGYDLSLYWIEVRDDIVPHDGGVYYFMSGKSRRRGVELAARAASPYGVSARLAAALSRNEYIEYRNLVGGTENVYDGNDAAGVPGRIVTTTLRYEAPAGVSLEWTGKTVGPYYADDANLARVPAFFLQDATLACKRSVGGREVEAFVSAQNLSDRIYVSSVWVNGADGRFYEPGMPRSFTAGVRLRAER